MNELTDFEQERRDVLKLGAVAATAPLVLPSWSQAAAIETALPTEMRALGGRHSRAEGALKVNGQARYAIEQFLPDMVYGVVVQSVRPAGKITAIDVSDAARAPGVLAIYTPQEPLRIGDVKMTTVGGAATETFIPLRDAQVRFNGQHVALVIADSFERATEAAHLVRITYEDADFILGLDDPKAKPQASESLKEERGDAVASMATADVKVEATYTTPREYNMPMEPHACIAAWEGEKLTVWESSQWVGGARNVIAEWMEMDIAKVRIVSPYIGGGFGSKVAPHPHVALACAAARKLGRPVKLSLTRQQTFTGFGGRPATRQNLAIGATRDGRLVSIIQEGWNETSLDDTYVEIANKVTSFTYAVPNVITRHNVVPVNTVTPGWMRAPGESPSAFALESAMDELAYALGIDPIELRLRNWADHDQDEKMPWSTRRLREAYAAGAKAFGWSRRNPVPRSMREGRELIGWGVAGGTYAVLGTPTEAKLIAYADGTFEVRNSGTDLGTGTYTILAQTAAEVLGVPVTTIKVALGDTTLPRAPLAGGSQLANSATGAVDKAARALRDALIAVAVSDSRSPLAGQHASAVVLKNGRIQLARRPTTGGLSISELLHMVGRSTLEAQGDTFKAGATEADRDDADRTFKQMLRPTSGGLSKHSWSAQFVEVRVDEDFGTVRVKRMVGAFDCGRVYNPKLAESQWIGGMTMGLGQALLEEGAVDPRDGRVVNASLADYVVPVNADVPEILTLSVGEPDYQASALGGKAVGELGIVGLPEPIANAVFHATGKRIRDLPITIEKIIG